MHLDLTAELKIKFKGEKQRYKVISAGKRYLVCNKPFNPRNTVLYTIIDLEKKIRGPENLVIPLGAHTKDLCDEMLLRLENGETEVSRRRNIPLDIEEVYARYR